MKRLNKQQRLTIEKLAIKDWSLNKISKKLNLPKTTVYYWFRKAVGRKIKPVIINRSSDEKIGEIIGIFAGDGNYNYDLKTGNYRIRIYFNKKEEEILNYYASLIKFISNKKPRIYLSRSMKIIAIDSKKLIEFIKENLAWERRNKTRTIMLKKTIKHYSKNFIVGFLRGLIDSDGYVRKERKEIYFGSVSKNLIKNFANSLELFDFKYKIYQQKQKRGSPIFYKVRITNNEVIRFCEKIRPIKGILSGYVGIRTPITTFPH